MFTRVVEIESLNVTVFWKIDHLRTFHILRNANL